ncbi:MAG: DUF6370 family protein [Gemmataceae bacterium]
MRFVLVAAMALSLTLVMRSPAQDQEVTLKGKITCAKCELNMAPRCTTVIVVKQNDKDVIYYFDPAAHKSIHSVVCGRQNGKNGSVIGTIAEKNGRKIVTVKKVIFER